jgi:nitric oxide dioxygenase
MTVTQVTPEQVQLIQAGIPLMEHQGDAFLKLFYDSMLEEHPELLKIFNKTHQASLAQPKALTRSVVLYAKNLDSLGNIMPLAERIIHKHASQQILPEHYPIVGKYLLRTMKELFPADVATPDFLNAWGTAYQQLADILIGAEGQVYKENAAKVGGWRGYREFKVVERKVESDKVSSFFLKPVDGGKVIVSQPGQYLGFRFEMSPDTVLCRQYSISDSVEEGADGYRVSVKRIPSGTISNHWHDTQKVGAIVHVSPPAGEFVLRENGNDVLLVGAGVGITPLVSLSRQALLKGRKVTLVQCDRSKENVPFGQHFSELQQKFPGKFHYKVFLSSVKRFDGNDLKQVAGTSSDIYVVGPAGFMGDVRKNLEQVPGDHHAYYDFFAPGEWE